jgi:hypothetical protein
VALMRDALGAGMIEDPEAVSEPAGKWGDAVSTRVGNGGDPYGQMDGQELRLLCELRSDAAVSLLAPLSHSA